MASRKRGFCSMCQPYSFWYELRGLKMPKYDDTCNWCGGYGKIPFKWRKGDRDRRVEDRRRG